MSKKVLGIDIGYDCLKLALSDGKNVKKAAIVPMSKNLLKEGRVVSIESLAELIKQSMKVAKIRAKNAALVLSHEVCYVKNVNTPIMAADQMKVNLPYEFRDYITDELAGYSFDYAMISTDEEEMKLTAAAVPLNYLEDMAVMLKKANLRLVNAAPVSSAYISLIRDMKDEFRPESGEYGILDIGYKTVKFYTFNGDTYEAERILETGLSAVDEVVAELYNVDIHLAHTYVTTNYEDCLQKQACLDAFEKISVELMRAVNFYRFRNPESKLEDLWLTGGGAGVAPLVEALERNLDLKLHPATELVTTPNPEEAKSLVLAAGIAKGGK